MRLEVVLRSPPVSARELIQELEGIIEDSVEVVVTDPGCMRILNRKYRRIDHPTDVLSFDLADSPEDRPEGVIYVDGRLAPPASEVIERILHGYLHLCGMSHDSEEDSEKMDQMLNSIMVSRQSGGETE